MKFELTNPKAWKAVSERNIPMAHKIKVYEKLGGAYRMGENGGEQVYNNIAELLKSKLNEDDGSDHEVGMALNLLDDVIKNANELKGKIGTQETNLAGWIQDHISQAQNFINQANTGFHKLDESIKAFDERHYGKKGLIIMIDDNGKKLSAVFKDKKNADKYNRNNPEDLKKLAQLAQKAGFGNTIDESLNEEFKYIIKVDSPREVLSKRVAAEVEKLAKSGARSKEIGLQMGFVGNNDKTVDSFQVLKNKIYFGLNKRESINENFPNMKKWWEEDKNEVMSFIYFLQGQIPPSNKEKYEKAWKDIVVQLQKRTPAPKNIYDKLLSESINEGASKAELDKVRQAVEAASSFMNVGSELKKLGIRYVFATEPLPIYIVQQTPNNRIAIVNKRYATKPDFVVGDIAVGVMD